MRLSASRTAISALPYFERTIARRQIASDRGRSRVIENSAALTRVRLHGEAEQVLEIGQAVVAAEAEIVAEELLLSANVIAWVMIER